MSETKDVLREVVNSPWFEWRDGMVAQREGFGGMPLQIFIRTAEDAENLPDTFSLADHRENVGFLLEMLRAHPRVMSTYLISCSRTEGATHDIVVDLRASAGAAGGGGPTGPAEYEGATDVQALAHAILALPGKP